MPSDTGLRSPHGSPMGLMARRMLVWTLAIGCLLGIRVFNARREVRRVALSRAQDSFRKDLAYRLWATQRGGVYVPLDALTPANPSLRDHTNREITSAQGKVYTLVNPAYMVRMVHGLSAAQFGIWSHLTSLNPVRPENSPDAWERAVLQRFESGTREYWDEQTLVGRPHLRYMGPLPVEPGCLLCHVGQGYQVGQVRGGISVAIPLDIDGGFLGGFQGRVFLLALSGLWGLGLLAMWLLARQEQRHTLHRNQALADRQTAERTLRTREALLRTYFDAAPDGIFVTDREGRYLQVNRAAEQMTGYPASELLGMTVQDLDVTQSGGAVPASFQTLLETHTILQEIELRRKDGSSFPVLLRAAKINDDLMIGLCRDLTEQKRLEAERRQLDQEIQHSQQLESLGSLAGGIAHDMNNVLAAVLGLGSVLQVKLAHDPALGRAVETILHAAGRGRDLVKGLTDFARKDLLEPRPLDLNALIKKEAALLHRTTLQRVELVLDLDPELPQVLGDPNALANALMNLCVNALDAMPKGGRLRLLTSHQDRQVQVRVEDTGEGMSPETQKRALEPFFTTKAVGKGTGLGLSMVYGTLKAHGGTIEIRSEPGQGTQIRLTLPALGDSPAEAVAAGASCPVQPQALRVLLVDDDELVRESVPTMLDLLGHRTETASGGLEALRRLQADLEVDLVILDLNMPGMSGLETLARIRLLRPELPILVATGFREEGLEDALAQHTGITLLLKPFELDHLAAKLREVLG